MVIDCDKFKQVNDEYGHLVGDQVIAGLAQLIRNNIPVSYTHLDVYKRQAFITTISLSYIVARNNIRINIIENELPLTGDSIYSEMQRDLIKPVFIADQMAHNTCLLYTSRCV